MPPQEKDCVFEVYFGKKPAGDKLTSCTQTLTFAQCSHFFFKDAFGCQSLIVCVPDYHFGGDGIEYFLFLQQRLSGWKREER